MDLPITSKMEKTIEEKTALVEQLNTKAKELLKKELHEKTERAKIVTKMEKTSEKKLTDKTKQAEADFQLKSTIVEIKTLKNEIEELKRNIGLCDDKLSLFRNMIRELELTQS